MSGLAGNSIPKCRKKYWYHRYVHEMFAQNIVDKKYDFQSDPGQLRRRTTPVRLQAQIIPTLVGCYSPQNNDVLAAGQPYTLLLSLLLSLLLLIGKLQTHKPRTPALPLAHLLTKLGNTSPGQSHSMRLLLRTRVWKCFVLPGVAPTLTLTPPCESGVAPTSTLITLLFPTLG